MIWAHSAIQTMGNHPPNILDIKIGVKPPANFWVFRWASLWNLDHCMEQSDPMMIVSTLRPREYREYPSLQITTHVRRICWNLFFSVAKIKSQYSPIDVYIYIYNYSFFASILITLISDDDVSNETHKHESLTHSSCWKQPDTHTHTPKENSTLWKISGEQTALLFMAYLPFPANEHVTLLWEKTSFSRKLAIKTA